MNTEQETVVHALSPPPANRVRYNRNFIKNAVCELRFPTLLELEDKAPINFQAKIRKMYPFFEKQVLEQVGSPEGAVYEQRYLFRSKDKGWTVSITSSVIAMETTAYTDFEEFSERFKHILESAKELVDTDFFTRIGLRYINSIPINDNALEGWVNSDLILPLTCGVLGEVRTSNATILGYMEEGQYTFRHGLKNNREGVRNRDAMAYTLDYDYFDENVEFGNVFPLLAYFNKMNFDFFSWCLGEKAKGLLGEGRPK